MHEQRLSKMWLEKERTRRHVGIACGRNTKGKTYRLLRKGKQTVNYINTQYVHGLRYVLNGVRVSEGGDDNIQ